MGETANLSQPIVETLYCEALVLADEVRMIFNPGEQKSACTSETCIQIAHATEGLRATTRMMFILAWLLNYRAHFSGDLSEAQLLRSGPFQADRPGDPESMALLPPHVRNLIMETQKLHARIARLDSAWRSRTHTEPPLIASIHERLTRAI
ncbi:MAG: DUF1465 family protein [Sphingomonadaceae bacterium]